MLLLVVLAWWQQAIPWLIMYEALCLCVFLYEWVLGWNVLRLGMCTILIMLLQQ